MKSTLALTLTVVILFSSLAVWMSPWFPADDAYISYRYAENWSSGHGPVFNPGERVEGYSNFLFMALVAGASSIGITPPLAGRCINAASAVAVIVLLLFALPGHLRESPVRYLVALVFAASYHTTANILSGLEAPFFAFLGFAGCLAFQNRRRNIAVLCFLALALTRPEGIALGLLFAVADMVQAWREGEAKKVQRVFRVWSLGLALPYLGYVLWRVIYYGSILPNSVHAKMGMSHLQSMRASLSYMAPALELYWPLLLLPIVSGLIAWWWRRSSTVRIAVPDELWGFLLFGSGVVVIAIHTGSGDPYLPFLRYLFPALPFLLALSVLSAEHMRSASRNRTETIVAHTITIALVLAQLGLVVAPRRPGIPLDGPIMERLIVGSQMLIAQDNRPHDTDYPRIPLGLHDVAAWLVDNAERGETLATAEVGIVPYYSGLRIIDTFGLITEHIAHLPGNPGAKSDPDFVFGQDPDYFVFKKNNKNLGGGTPADVALYRDARFRQGYEFVRSFPDGARAILLFKKRSPTAGEPRLVYDFCSNYQSAELVLRDKAGSRVTEEVPWLRKLTGKAIASVYDDQHRNELFKRLQPVILAGGTDPKATELVAEWLSVSACYIRQLPVTKMHDVALVYHIRVPTNGAMKFRFGFPADTRNNPEGPDIVFEIEIVNASSESTPVFLESVDVLDSIHWIPAEIDLTAFGGQEVDVLFRVYQLGTQQSRTVYDAGWLNMLLFDRELEDTKAGPDPVPDPPQ